MRKQFLWILASLLLLIATQVRYYPAWDTRSAHAHGDQRDLSCVNQDFGERNHEKSELLPFNSSNPCYPSLFLEKLCFQHHLVCACQHSISRLCSRHTHRI